MRWTWQGLAFLVLALFGLAGCKSAQQPIKHPKIPEEYVAPPETDKRYSQPVEYPKDSLNQDKQLYKEFNPQGSPGSAGGPRSASGTRMGAGGPGGY